MRCIHASVWEIHCCCCCFRRRKTSITHRYTWDARGWLVVFLKNIFCHHKSRSFTLFEGGGWCVWRNCNFIKVYFRLPFLFIVSCFFYFNPSLCNVNDSATASSSSSSWSFLLRESRQETTLRSFSTGFELALVVETNWIYCEYKIKVLKKRFLSFTGALSDLIFFIYLRF